MKTRIFAFLILLSWGLLKFPFESKLSKTMEEQRLGGKIKITADLRQRLGQAGVAAVLGGLRGAVSDFAWIRANVAWQATEYGRMKFLYDTCIILQPTREMYYEMAAWMMAWNGGAFMEKTITDPVEKQREVEKYWKLGESYAIQGTQNVPNSWVVWLQLGSIYHYKFKDYAKAAWAYDMAAQCPNRLEYVKRFGAFMLAKIPGREQEAYDRLLALYKEGKDNWVLTLLVELQRLEEFLNIPQADRQKIDPVDLLPPGEKYTRKMKEKKAQEERAKKEQEEKEKKAPPSSP